MPLPLLPIALGIGAAASAYGQSKASGRAADISEAQLEFLKQKYAEQEPLRAIGLSRLQMPLPERPDQSAAFADSSNPFYKPPQALGFGSGYTNQSPPLSKALPAYRDTAGDAVRHDKLGDIEKQRAAVADHPGIPPWLKTKFNKLYDKQAAGL